MPFRSDLNENEQMQSIREHRDRVRHQTAMLDWMDTRASRENHRIMLHMLVHEAHRCGGSNNTSLQNSPSLSACSDTVSEGSRAQGHYGELHQYVDQIMSQQDNYGSALQEIGRLGLFNSAKSSTNDLNSSFPECDSPAKHGCT